MPDPGRGALCFDMFRYVLNFLIFLIFPSPVRLNFADRSNIFGYFALVTKKQRRRHPQRPALFFKKVRKVRESNAGLLYK